MKNSKNQLKEVVKINPADQEIIDAVLNGYTVCGFHKEDGETVTLFFKD